VPANVTLHELGPHNLDAFVHVSVRAWEREPSWGRVVEATQLRAFAAGPEVIRSWLVTLDGEGVGTTTLRLLPGGIGYLQGAAVVPEHRRAGVYRAMVNYRLAVLRELGFPHAVIWANERSSGPGCERMGFVARCRGLFFEWRRKA
jgi:GNAT superfamily N-acetyltransferase